MTQRAKLYQRSGICSKETLRYDDVIPVLAADREPTMRLPILLLCLSLPVVVAAQQPLTPQQVGSAPLTKDEAAALRNNQVNFGVSSTETIDDGPVGSAAGQKEWSVLSAVRPEIGLQIDRARLQSTLQYSPSFSYGTAVATSNNLSQAAGLNLQYHFTKRLSIGIRESYVLTNDPFDSLRANSDLSGFGILEKPTTASLATNVRSRSEQLGSDLIYRLSAHTSIGAGGTFGKSNYQSLEAANGTSQHSQNWTGFGYVSHALTPRYSVAAQYTAQSLASETQFSSTSFAHEVLGFWNVSWNRNLQFSLFAGPNFSQIDHLGGILPVGTTSRTSLSAGASLTWQGEHNGLAINFSQRESDSGVSGAGVTNMRLGNISLRRRIGRLWIANIFANYAAESQLDTLSPVPGADSVSAGVGLGRVLTPRLTLSVTGFRQQFIGDIPPLFLQRNHDVVAVSLGYRMSRPIGR